MEITLIVENDIDVAVVSSETVKIFDIASAMSFLTAILHETGCDRVVVHESIFDKDFFNLETKLTKNILHRFISCRVRLAIVGSNLRLSKPEFAEFIIDFSRHGQILIAQDEKEAIHRISEN